MAYSDERIRARLDRLEIEALTHPRRHALRLVALVLLGYLYPVLLVSGVFCLFLVALALSPAALESLHGEEFIAYLLLLLALLAACVVVLRVFWIDLPPPIGQVLGPNEAKPLRDLVNEMQHRLAAPRVHHIHLDARMNAGVLQQQRFGFWGPRTNYLVIGLPMLIAIGSPSLRAVLAHEYGHLHRRHGRFRAWIYRVQQTWYSLATPFRAGNWMQWIVAGWFVKWYGTYLSTSTLALRRLHEYQADGYSAEIDGSLATANALLAISWIEYRLERTFWPGLLREAGTAPLPPADVHGRMMEFLTSPPHADSISRWQTYELLRRTPINSEHPCLAERLTALGHRKLLEDRNVLERILPALVNPQKSSLALLGECSSRHLALANASWKVMAIQRWRMEHAVAKHMLETAEKAAAKAGADPEGSTWEVLHVRVENAHPDEAMEMLRGYLATHAGHAGASFTLGKLLLDQHDEGAVAHLEDAMRGGSDYLTPSLNMLLNYYRQAGRDSDADPILQRLEAHEKSMAHARRERLKVSRREQFLAHDLDDQAVLKLRRMLFSYPQIRSAYLARKQVKIFADKPSYVLAIERHSHPLDNHRKANKYLLESLHSQVNQSCAIVILGWNSASLRRRLQKVCPAPVYLAER